MIKQAISQLLDKEDLSSEVMRKSMEEIMEGVAAPSQIGAFLVLLRAKGETVNEITQAARVMREKALKVTLEGDVIDTCSTGGTGINHFNISTASAFVLAGQGLQVAKHGNRALSGRCGSADVLAALGANVEMRPEEVQNCINEIGIGFMFAPVFHLAMKHAAAPRREVGVRTIFNILGPLTNPASATHQVMGVYSSDYTECLAEVLGNLGLKKAMVVHGDGGLDEIALSGPTKVSEFKNGKVFNYELYPGDFGLGDCPVEEIKGGTDKDNAKIMRSIFDGEDSAYRKVVAANSAAAFVVAGKAGDIKEGVEMASDSIDSGRAGQKLNQLIEYSRNKRI